MSQPVLEEASVGDQETAQHRLSVLEDLPLLEITEAALTLAKDLVRLGPLPQKAEVDALHIAIAVTNRVDYLLTWNCKHLANAALRSRIERVCRARGYDPIIICTPEELLRSEMPWEDPIVEEVRKARDAYAKRFNYDLDAIYRDLKEKERRSGRVMVPCPTKQEAVVGPDETQTGESA